MNNPDTQAGEVVQSVMTDCCHREVSPREATVVESGSVRSGKVVSIVCLDCCEEADLVPEDEVLEAFRQRRKEPHGPVGNESFERLRDIALAFR